MMNMIKNLSFSALFTFIVIFVSCASSDDEPVVSGSIIGAPTQINVDYGDSLVYIEVTSTAEWKAFSDEDWISCSPSGSIDLNGTVEVSIDANANTSVRQGTITLKSGSNYAKIGVTQAARPIDTNIEVPDGYEMVWNDEFVSGSKPDTNNWWYETGNDGWGNNEIQNYVDGSINGEQLASVDDGILSIICKKVDDQVCSIRMNTSQSWKYGYFEARLKLPSGKGTWPAFWMMPKDFNAWPDDGEIDIMEEVGYNANYVSSSIHCSAYNHSMNTQKTKETYVANAQEEFHVYALEWTEDYIKTYVDGKILFTFENDGNGDKTTWPFDAAFYLKLNLAWGGDWGGAQGVDETALPSTYMIDYVRVFQKK